MSKVKIVKDPEIQKSYPDLAKCIIEVRLADGTCLEAVSDVPRGDPKKPLSDKELEEKLETYFFFAAKKTEVSESIERIWTLEQQADLDWLIAPLKRRLI